MSRWLAIANPAAGTRGTSERLARELSRKFPGRVDVVLTSRPGHAQELAHASKDYEGLAAIGGDGTVAEILNGMRDARRRLAVVPAGHGNCLARDLGVATPRLAFDAMEAGTWQPVDVMHLVMEFGDGRRHECLCASTIALGYVADVVALGRGRLPALGRYAYSVAAFCTRPAFSHIALEGGACSASGRLSSVIINNTAHLANFRAFRRARLDDGQLDVMAMARGWPRQMLHNIAVLLGSERFGPSSIWQLPAVTVDCAAPSRLMVDGELHEDVVRLTVRCEPSLIDCCCPGR